MVLRELIESWSQNYPDDELSVLVPASRRAVLPKLPVGTSIFSSRLRLHPLINLLGIPWLQFRCGSFDFVLCQNFASPVRNSSVIIYDVLFESNPEWFTRAERLYLAPISFFAPLAKVVFASSESEKRRILRWVSRVSRVVVTGLGIPSALQTAEPEPVPGLTGGEFFLSVGRLNVRKNLARAIEGALLSGRLSPSRPLVIVGDKSGRAEILGKNADAAIASGAVRFTGQVRDAQLRWLYSNCVLMIYLALDEGHGLPPLEAISFGARALVSDIPVMHENLGYHADYVAPTDLLAIAKAIRNSPITRVESTFVGTQWAKVVQTIRREAANLSSEKMRQS
jgi:glycosyltransferase involved in cell wall biosynthesis